MKYFPLWLHFLLVTTFIGLSLALDALKYDILIVYPLSGLTIGLSIILLFRLF
jgi:hypothetical protein